MLAVIYMGMITAVIGEGRFTGSTLHCNYDEKKTKNDQS